MRTVAAIPWWRALLATVGLVSVALGLFGLFIPGWPTSEFVLLASYLFARSSPRLDRWLADHRWIGPPLRRLRETGGLTRQAKALALAWMWTGVAVSVVSGLNTALQLVLVGSALGGTLTLLLYVRTTTGSLQLSPRRV